MEDQQKTENDNDINPQMNCGESCGCDAPAPEVPEINIDPKADSSDPEVVEEATEELMKWREMALRSAAEYDNYRKRCIKEREDFNRYAKQSLIEELLPVIDNFEMGMQMAGQDTKSMIYIGMNMVQKQLHDFLNAQGVTTIPCEIGDTFDHNKHDAIQSEPSALPEGSIVRIVRKGYMLKDRLLRPVNVMTAAAPASDQ